VPIRGHLQAVGFDARGRKQYRYHPRTELCASHEVHGMPEIARGIASVRERVRHHLTLSGMPRERFWPR